MFPASKKVYIKGKIFKSIRVPMREIFSLTKLGGKNLKEVYDYHPGGIITRTQTGWRIGWLRKKGDLTSQI